MDIHDNEGMAHEVPQVPMPQDMGSVVNTVDKKAKRGFVLGIIGMIAWFIPLFGLPITIFGVVYSAQGMKSTMKHGLAVAGLVLSIIGLFLTVVNASIGAYLGATGQYPIVNELMNKNGQQPVANPGQI